VADTATAKSTHLLRTYDWVQDNIRNHPDLRHLALASSIQPSAEALDQYNTELRVDYWSKSKTASGMSKEVDKYWRMHDRKGYADDTLISVQADLMSWLQRRFKHLYTEALENAKAEDRGDIPARSNASIFAEIVELWNLRVVIPTRVDKARLEKELPKAAIQNAAFLERMAQSHPLEHTQLLIQQQTLLQQSSLAAAAALGKNGKAAATPKDTPKEVPAWKADKAAKEAEKQKKRKDAATAASALSQGAARQAGTPPGLQQQ
jgi:hypothetical protein